MRQLIEALKPFREYLNHIPEHCRKDDVPISYMWVFDERGDANRYMRLTYGDLRRVDAVIRRQPFSDDWLGFRFRKPAPPQPLKFFEGIDTSQLYSVDETFNLYDEVTIIASGAIGRIVATTYYDEYAVQTDGDEIFVWHKHDELQRVRSE